MFSKYETLIRLSTKLCRGLFVLENTGDIFVVSMFTVYRKNVKYIMALLHYIEGHYNVNEVHLLYVCISVRRINIGWQRHCFRLSIHIIIWNFHLNVSKICITFLSIYNGNNLLLKIRINVVKCCHFRLPSLSVRMSIFNSLFISLQTVS